MANHGVYVNERETSISTPIVASVSVPFVIGCAPVQAAINPAAPEVPVLCTSWDEFESRLGYSEDWSKYNLCEFAYSHFKLFGCQPVIFCNLLDPATMKEAVEAKVLPVTHRRAYLPIEAIPSSVVVKKADASGEAYKEDTDYSLYVSNDQVVVELLGSSAHAEELSLSISYDAVTPGSVTAALVASKMDTIELCMSTAGIIPDLIAAPGYSSVPSVAAVMATKAAGINGLFTAKALVDIDCTKSGCTDYSKVSGFKSSKNLVDECQIVCWPEMKLGDKQFRLSTQLAGLMAQVDGGNSCPYESPSNKSFQMDGLCLADGTAVIQTKAQADLLNAAGVVTALNFLSSGWVCWGNYTACYPSVTDVKDYFIPVSRMFGWIGNSLIQSFWSKLDRPMNRRLLDSIVDSCNIWLNGLTGSGYLLGGRAEVLDSENPVTDLMAGIIRIHLYLTPPSPAQEIDFVLEYDPNYVTGALS